MKVFMFHLMPYAALDMDERDRQRVQRGKIMTAIQEVQGDATTLRRAAQDLTEDLLNDTVIKNWMPWLFDAMVGPDADPDVKRMALEAGDKANINQISILGRRQQATMGRLRHRVQDPADPMDPRQPDEGYWRHAAATFG